MAIIKYDDSDTFVGWIVVINMSIMYIVEL